MAWSFFTRHELFMWHAGLTSSNDDVTPDGRRFLMIQDENVATTSSDRLVLVLGCADALKRQMS